MTTRKLQLWCRLAFLSCLGVQGCGGDTTQDGRENVYARAQALCDDENACTTDWGIPPACYHGYTTAGASCEGTDGYCSGTGTCDGQGECVVTLWCDDTNACTMDSCVSGIGCYHTPRVCNDFDACTVDTCNSYSGCVHTQVNCEDGNQCTIDVCMSGNCEHTIKPSETCSDGNACTAGDVCSTIGTCGGTSVDPTDTNPCTIDSCDTATGVHNDPDVGRNCDDLNPLNGEELCDSVAACVHLPRSESVASAEAVLERRFGGGPHPVAASTKGVAVAFSESDVSTANGSRVGVAVFSEVGVPVGVATMSGTIFEAGPVVAPLPDGSFALAYTAEGIDGDGLGVALVRVSGAGDIVGTPVVANSIVAFGQMNADLVWTGTELVAAWEDESTANGRRICVRRFNGDLSPLAEESCQKSGGVDSRVSIGVVNGDWVAAWRRDVTKGSTTSSIAVHLRNDVIEIPMCSGSLDEHPAVAGLDSEHVLVAFTDGELRAVVLNSVGDQQEILVNSGRDQPALASISGGVVLGWRVPAVLGDGGWNAELEELMVQHLPWDGAQLDSSTHPAIPVPTNASLRVGDQRAVRLVPLAFLSQEAMVIGWEDWAPNVTGHASHGDVLFSIEVIPFGRESE